jgi:hypothetical protein
MNNDKRFATERARLMAALGAVTAGGVIEAVEPLNRAGASELEIALSVWPCPIEAAALRELGYRLVSGPRAGARPGSGEQRFRHTRRAVGLYVVEAGSGRWQDAITLREYRAHHPGTRSPRQARADAWWMAHFGFWPVAAVVKELAGFDRPWRIASGWALDLFLGQVSRVHHDVDVEIARDDQLALRGHLAARGWSFVTPYEGRLEPWPPDLRLEGARHQVHAHREGAHVDGTFIDILLADMLGPTWHYRRQPEVTRHLSRAVLRSTAVPGSAEGVPFIAPELALLFKSKNTSGREREKDQADFERVYPRLEPERRAWLKWALEATQPGHPWIERLGT